MAHAPEKLVLPFFGMALLLLVLSDVSARLFSLYWVYPWFDMPMHVLGGVTIALGYHSLPTVVKRIPHRYRTLWYTLAVVVGIGVCWEVFEFEVGYSRVPGLLFDTATDMLCDTIGAFIGYYFVRIVRSLA